MATATYTDLDGPGRFRRFWASDVRRRFTENKLAVAALVWLMIVILACVLGPLLADDPNRAQPLARLKPPSLDHLFGTDQLGRDLFARVLAGGRASLTTAIVATGLAILLGGLIGVVTGYRGGAVDEVLSRVFDVLTTFPTLLLGIIVVVALGPSLSSVIIALAISDIPLYGRLFRAGVLSAKSQEYVLGVRSFGMPAWRIVLHHILPNITVPILVIAAGAMGRVALSEASLSFLGAGIQPPTASWGNMMSDGQSYLQVYPWFPIIPGTILTSVTIAFSFVGDALRDAFDLRQSATARAEDSA
jgi:peptide/nickel transport system permease protein